MIFNFELVEETVIPHFTHDGKGNIHKKTIMFEAGAWYEVLERESEESHIWTFMQGHGDFRKPQSVIARFKKAFKQSNIKCLSITKHYDEYGY